MVTPRAKGPTPTLSSHEGPQALEVTELSHPHKSRVFLIFNCGRGVEKREDFQHLSKNNPYSNEVRLDVKFHKSRNNSWLFPAELGMGCSGGRATRS